jgi:hypothetical protein
VVVLVLFLVLHQVQEQVVQEQQIKVLMVETILLMLMLEVQAVVVLEPLVQINPQLLLMELLVVMV